MSLTAAQSQAIAARGNVLLIAGAGTGKTRTLVERCIDCLLNERPRVSLDQILMVTFTEAAAAEMRHRIRKRLEQEASKAPSEHWWQEQLALFDTAHIGTLHSFCLRVIREHFYELELDPQLAVLPEEEAQLVADDTLESLMQEMYASGDPFPQSVRKMIQEQGGGTDVPIRRLVLKIHRYTQTLPGAVEWLENQKAAFADPSPRAWAEWFQFALDDWKARWLPVVTTESAHNGVAKECLAILGHLKTPASAQFARVALDSVCLAIRNCPYGNKKLWLKPLKEFEAEAQFLCSLTPGNDNVDPLAEDWSWVREHMGTLVGLVSRFTIKFTETKRELGTVDFQDLEQYALRVLWDAKSRQPTAVARLWRDKLRFVFVDEYQDINAAQDKIIECLSREGAHANRFLVGDVKQSIYRFRLAAPAIFQGYANAWREGAGGKTIPLQDNFRSREPVLGFVNSVFSQLMREEMGGVTYDDAAQLRPGQRAGSTPAPAQDGPVVELHLRLKGSSSDSNGEDEASDELKDLAEADKEARLVALRLRELKGSGFRIWDEVENRLRPVDWGDMAVLLRSPSGKSESYAKEFSRLGVPLVVERGGFYRSIEVSDLVSLLQLLDNPLQDIPTLAVLRSPLVGLSANELALIRLASKGRYWTALTRWHQGQLHRKPAMPGASGQPQLPGLNPEGAEDELLLAAAAFKKVDPFLERFGRWRALARHVSLCRCLETVLAETHYQSWVLTLPRGEQRHANVNRLLGLAQQFDRFRRQGLFRFLRFLEAQQEAGAEPNVAAVSGEKAVRLMSIHQSKGLEFPVVVVADLAKNFNDSDLRSEIILDEKYGLCPQVKPPHTGKTYPSLAYWLARQRQARELLGEELRLLYVAATRARDKLLLVGSLSRKRFQEIWLTPAELNLVTLLRARSYADWLGRWFARTAAGTAVDAYSGDAPHLHWTLHEETALVQGEGSLVAADQQGVEPFDAPGWKAVQDKLAVPYGASAATLLPAKTSVTMLRRRAAVADDEELSVALSFARDAVSQWKKGGARHVDAQAETRESSPVEIGSAHHLFLQLVSLERVIDVAALRTEASRLVDSGALTPGQAAALDYQAIADFWASQLGRDIRAHSECVHRELPFTFRAGANELNKYTGAPTRPELEREMVVVQGVADLAVILPGEIWLVDFKTDAVRNKELAEKANLYEPQLKIYAVALSRIYSRPVTRCSLYFLALGAEVPIAPLEETTGRVR